MATRTLKTSQNSKVKFIYLFPSQSPVDEEESVDDLRRRNDKDWEDGAHGDGPAEGVGPRGVLVVALGQRLVLRPRVQQDDLFISIHQ